MNIILEGLDASGKSTLANKIQSKYSFPIIKKRTGDITNFIDFKNNTIYDRHFVSEWVFQRVYNRPAKLNDKNFEFLKKVATIHNSLIVILICSDMKIIFDRLLERGELNYLKEMDSQQKYFTECINTLLKDYPNLYVIDIAKPNAYEDVEAWITYKIEKYKNIV